MKVKGSSIIGNLRFCVSVMLIQVRWVKCTLLQVLFISQIHLSDLDEVVEFRMLMMAVSVRNSRFRMSGAEPSGMVVQVCVTVVSFN